MNPDELIYGAKYIWIIGGEERIVSLSVTGDSLVDKDLDYWWFKNGLWGQLYGPIEF